MASFKQIMEEVQAAAKAECCTKTDDSPPDFEPITEDEFNAAKDMDIGFLVTKEGAWSIGQPTPIVPELSVIFIFRAYDEDRKIDPDSDARIYCVPTAAATKKGTALFPTRLTIPAADILRMGEGMSIETWREAATAEIVDMVLGEDGDEDPNAPEVPGALEAPAVANGAASTSANSGAVATS